MPPIEKTNVVTPVQEEKSEEEIQASKPVIGIIYPPPEVRSILEISCSIWHQILGHNTMHHVINCILVCVVLLYIVDFISSLVNVRNSYVPVCLKFIG